MGSCDSTRAAADQAESASLVDHEPLDALVSSVSQFDIMARKIGVLLMSFDADGGAGGSGSGMVSSPVDLACAGATGCTSVARGWSVATGSSAATGSATRAGSSA